MESPHIEKDYGKLQEDYEKEISLVDDHIKIENNDIYESKYFNQGSNKDIKTYLPNNSFGDNLFD